MAVLQSTTITGSLTMNSMTAGFMKVNAQGAVVMDTNTYATTGSLSSYLALSGGTLTGDLRFSQGAGFGRIAFTDNYHGMILRGFPSDAAGNVTVTDVTSLIQHSGDFRFYRTNGSINELYFQVNASGLNWRGNTVWHAGNLTNLNQLSNGPGYVTGGPYLPLSGGTMSAGINFSAPGGSILLKHAVSEVDAWIFQENAANWGIYWKNAPSGHHTFGGYTTVGAETFGMSAANASGNGVLTSNFVGATSAYAQWMLSNYTGYIWSASTIFAAGDMRAPQFRFTNSGNSAFMTGDAGWGARIQTDSGYILFGPANGSYAHIYTDRGQFYFNKDILINNVQVVVNSGTWSINVTGTAGSISGYNNPTTAATANTIVYRDGSGHISGNYIFGSYFNSSAGNSENPTIGQVWTQSTGDNYLRKSTPAHFISQLGLITSSNIGSQSVNYANSSGSVSGLTLNSINSAINPDNVTQNQIGYNGSVNLFGQTDGGLYSSAYNVNWIHQIYGDFRSGQIAIRGKQSGTWQAWRTVLDSSNYTSYAPSLTGGGASGTWGISITGNAGSVGGRVVGTSTDNIPFLSGTRNLVINNPESYSGEVRLGAAWDRGGVYASNILSLGTSGSAIHFVFSNATKAYFDTGGNLWMGQASGASSIYMGDSDEGQREIHCNSNRIGFLTQGGSWGAWCNDGGSWESVSSITTNDWFYVNGAGGIYWSSYGGGWRMNGSSYIEMYGSKSLHMQGGSVDYVGSLYLQNGPGVHLQGNTDGSYGSLQITQSKNGWSGIYFTASGNHLMANNNEVGHYQVSVGWKYRWYQGTMYVSRGTTGGGSEFTVLDSGNYTGTLDGRYFFDYGFTEGYPGTNANNMPGNRSAFTYSNGAPYTGPIAHFGAAGYGLQLNANYGDGTLLGYRVRNGDNATWGSWRRLVWEGGTWSFSITGNAATVGGYAVAVGGSANTIPTRNGSGYLIPENWIQLNGIYGLYSPTNNAHLRPNDASYGSWLMTGSRNGWQGIEFNSGGAGNVTMMIHTDSNTSGFHNNSYGWQIRWANGTLYCGKNSYGGNDATVLDSSNYSSWAQPISSAINTGNITSQAVTSLISTHFINQRGSYGSWNADFNNTPAGTMTHGGDLGANGSNGPGGSWWMQQNFRHTNSSNSWGIQVAWGWEDNANRLATRNITGGSFGGWVYYLNSSNYSNWAVPIGGATLTNVFYFQTNQGAYLGSSDSARLQVYNTNNQSAFMSFHRSGQYAVNFGLDQDNVMRIGGWSASANRWQLDMSGNMTVAGDVTAYSDARVKENVHTVENALDKTLRMRGVTYNRTDSDDKKTKVGVIAQEMLEVLPEVVNQDNAGMYNVSYGNIVGVLIEAIKEQQQQIEDLKSKLDAFTK